MSTGGITGITGYIGSRMAQMMLSEHTVCGLVREPLNRTYLPESLLKELRLFSVHGGGGIQDAIAASQPDIVYHLAAFYTSAHDMNSVDRLVESNLLLGAEVLEAMTAAGCRRLVYATTTSTHSAGEPYSPLTLYAATKQAFSDLVTYYTGRGFLRAAAVSIADSYGPGDLRPKVLDLIRRSALEGTSIQLTSGRQLYDAVYIDDIIRGFDCAAQSLEQGPAHQFFQLHNREAKSLRETVELMLRVNDVSFQPEWGAKPGPLPYAGEGQPVYPAPPGWWIQVPLSEGLRRFWTDT